jgi:hypothetical protein
MSRVIAVVACGFLLSACGTSWMPSMPSMGSFDWPSARSPSSPGAMPLIVETDPPGADVKASAGGACRTPCTLQVQPSGSFTVDVSLNGYVPQSVPVRYIAPDYSNRTADGVTDAVPQLDPNPVVVALERAPAPPAKKKPAAKKSPVASTKKPATADAQPSGSFSTSSSTQPASSASAPWPMPR